MGTPAFSAFPSRQLTEIGGEFPAWEANGKRVHWSLGNGHWVYDVARAEFVEDSVKTAKKLEAQKTADSIKALLAQGPEAKKLADSLAKKYTDSMAVVLKADTARAKREALAKEEQKKKEKYSADETQVKVYFNKDIPNATMVLKHARIVTMMGE